MCAGCRRTRQRNPAPPARRERVRCAALGARSLEEVIGETGLLEPRATRNERHATLDLAPLLAAHGDAPRASAGVRNAPRDPGTLATRMLADMRDAIDARSGGEFAYAIGNGDRAIGARYLRAFVEEMKASGFVADALARSGQSASVAPPMIAPYVACFPCGRYFVMPDRALVICDLLMLRLLSLLVRLLMAWELEPPLLPSSEEIWLRFGRDGVVAAEAEAAGTRRRATTKSIAALRLSAVIGRP